MLASHTVTGPRTQELAQQCHCLAFHTAVCCNQKEKKKKEEERERWGVFLEPGAGVWEHGCSRGLDLGERQEGAGGPAWSQGGLGLGLGLGPTCFVM